MGGGLMQLVAYGAQDVYLTGNPQITFWKVTYRRYTNFSLESIEQTFNGQADFGRRVTCTISRNGDLASRTFLQVTLPEVSDPNDNDNFAARWLDFPGHQLIAQIEVEIGGQRIDRQYGDWMHIWTELTLSGSQKSGVYKMLGNTTSLTYTVNNAYADVDGPCEDSGIPQVCQPRKALPETTLYIPLQFWFCTNPGLALPLIALQYHEVKINIDFRPLDECLWAVNPGSAPTAGTSVQYMALYNLSMVAASLYIDYVFLDTDERRRMAQNPHEYLIQQLQFTGDESIGSSSNKIKLNFNHPCKELVWVVQPDANVDYCNSFLVGEPQYNLLGAQPFNYTDALDALPNDYHAFSTSAGMTEFITLTDADDTMSGQFAQAPGAAQAAATSSVGDASTFVLAETALDMHCWGSNPVVVAKLQLNGQDRFSEREGTYFDVVQPYEYHSHSPDTGINVYSFSLKPEEHQPSGTCNFSRIDNATLQMVVSNETVKETRTAKVRVYATNYNVLRVMSGMGGLAYSN
jgi:hypothetical protein